jgi:hypothetical protein
MAFYDALIAAWNNATQPPAGVTGTGLTAQMTTAQKLDAINGWTVAGTVDVPVEAVVGNLMLSGAYLTLAAFSQGAPTGNATHDTALGAAKTLMALLTLPNVPPFGTSNSTTYAIVKGMADAILAQETATPGSTGFTQAIHDGLLALAATTIPWSQANDYGPSIGLGYLNNAGLS